MNSENSKTYKPHFLILQLSDKVNLRRGEKSIALSILSIYHTWKNIKSSNNNNEFKTYARVISDIQDSFVLKNMEKILITYQ